MRALSYAGPWRMDLIDVAEPAPDESWVLVDIIATGICGTDAHGFAGANGRRVEGQIMGHETVGRLRAPLNGHDAGTLVTVNPVIGCARCSACDSGQTQMCPSIRVLGVDPALPGSFADVMHVPENNVVVLDDSMPVLHGTQIEPLAVGFHAVKRGDPGPDERVVIIGGGPIGQAAALGARRLGVARVLVSEPVAERRGVLEQLGFATTTPEELVDDAERVLGGRATLVIDAVGIEQSLQASVEVSVPGSRIVLVGMGAPELLLRPYGFSAFERSLIGSYCYSPEHFRETAKWVSEGQHELDFLIDEVRPLEEGQAAFTRVAEASSGGNKTLLFSAGARAEDLQMRSAA